ncbi:hypothetical protein MTO96_029329 [Rhipicephalus appendiculatus]
MAYRRQRAQRLQRRVIDRDLQEKIIKQVNYYFGDVNLSRDMFLREKIDMGYGWVEIDVLLTFNKLRSLTEKRSRRCLRYPPLNQLAFGSKHRRNVDELLAFFGQFGQCVDVYMRRFHKTRKFKGSVFAIFATKDEADAFLARHSVKFGGLELTRAAKQTPHASRLKKDAQYEELAEALEPYAEVAFVDYCYGKGEAVVRFVEEGSARAVLAKLEEQGKGLNIDGERVTAEALEAGEEVEYWKKLAAIKLKLRSRRRQRRSRSVQCGKKRRIEERSVSPDNTME